MDDNPYQAPAAPSEPGFQPAERASHFRDLAIGPSSSLAWLLLPIAVAIAIAAFLLT